jgi:polyferredoxin
MDERVRSRLTREKSVARRARSESRESRIFGVALAAILAALGALALFKDHPARAAVLLPAALASAALPFVAPRLWIRGFRLWMKVAEGLAWISTRVLLGAFFYLVLAPFGILSRRFRQDPLDLEWKDGKPTYWRDKTPEESTVERYERMY